jgi:ribosomal protein L44E
MEFGEIIVWVALLLPVVVGLYNASKGVSREDLQLPCAACKTMIPATARVCPYCRRSAGHDVFSKRGKAADNNSKKMRFLYGLIGTFAAEIVVVVLIAMLFK